jgi:hypothetical protein
MKMILKSMLFMCVILSSLTLSAQQSADLGVRVNTSDLNRLQLEFRKPLGEKYAFRLGATYGQLWYYPWTSVSDASDTMVTSRTKEQSSLAFDLRFGIERKLKWNYLSLHADLITGYYQYRRQSYDVYSVLDSNNNWSDPTFSGLQGMDHNLSSATDHFVSVGLAGGISVDYPFAKRLILNLNASYIMAARFQFSHQEYNDFSNEYPAGNSFIYELYPSAGIGLRYSLQKNGNPKNP